MTQQPSENGNHPVSQAEVQSAMRALQDSFERVFDRMEADKNDVKYHFDAAIQHIEDQLIGANRDELLLLKDRIARIEEHLGMSSAMR